MSNEADVPANHSLPGPEPNAGQDAERIEVGEKKAFMFDELGPMVVNKDGTLSRVANWPNMAPLERESGRCEF
ncbi:uncharacterized protein LAESUDRAFT_729319 [Laetiporus sulphureus 93-53]|uniref:Uncharacterized protein n=1 Tax=Laetiporus sulphureus 93-53 TaxID=1314785 RepID=A0A165CR92_9APHY|nr:uncharacterized protein LAESUDRAFT_729319 [Laetiporus sulphureus 93-53]KZT03284.1 hypothetical protein LAESUDRAFT_729319 [Laetiporus sulphureus 93-53]